MNIVMNVGVLIILAVIVTQLVLEASSAFGWYKAPRRFLNGLLIVILFGFALFTIGVLGNVAVEAIGSTGAPRP